jgi:undecaprenyl-diphosphatase
MLIQRPSRMCVASFAAFVVLTGLVVLGITQAWDVGVMQAIGTFRDARPATLAAARAATALGNVYLEIAAAMVMAWVLWRFGRGDRAWRFVLTCLSAELCYAVAKQLIRRPRPDAQLIAHMADAGWYSYPSGHAMLGLVIWGLGFFLLARTVPSRGAVALFVLLGVALPTFLAVSRPYLGVHYPTDVLGAVMLGMAWVLLWREDPVAP